MTRGGSGALLSATGISRRFGGMWALSGIDLDVRPDEFVAIIGPNGAGKTTFFNVLTGILRPSSGRILFEGTDVTNLPVHRRARLGISRTMQINSIFPGLSVLDNILIGVQSQHAPWNPIRYGVPRRAEMVERAEQIAELAGLADRLNEICSTLAYGDQRLVEIALALSRDSKLVLLDEPTAGLSPKETREITERLREIRQRRAITMIIVEHDMEVAMGLASRVVVLHQGECLAIGAPDEIMANETVNQVYLRGHHRADA